MVSIVDFSKIEDRLDAEYYQQHFLDVESISEEYPEVKTIADLEETIVNGVEIREYTNDGLPYLRVSDLKEMFLDLTDVKFIRKDVKITKNIDLNLGDLLFSRSGSLGIIAIVTEEIVDAIISSHLIKVRLNDINPCYAATFFSCKLGRQQILRRNNGTVVPEINQPSLRTVKVPLPSKSFQEHIEQLIREAYSKRTLANEKYKETKDVINQTLGISKQQIKEEKVFETTFSEISKSIRLNAEYYEPKFKAIDLMKQTSDLEILSVAQIRKQIGYGTSEDLTYTDKGVPFLRVTDINNLDYIDPEETKKISKHDAKRLNNYEVTTRDILISRTGSIGNAVFIDKSLDGSIFGSYFIKIRLEEGYNPFYVAIFLNSMLGRLQSERLTSGAIQTNITIPAIESMEIAFPKSAVQKAICNSYKQAVHLRKDSRRLIQQAKQEVEKRITRKVY